MEVIAILVMEAVCLVLVFRPRTRRRVRMVCDELGESHLVWWR